MEFTVQFQSQPFNSCLQTSQVGFTRKKPILWRALKISWQKNAKRQWHQKGMHVSEDFQRKCYIMPAARTPCTLPSWACEAWIGVECIKPCDQVPFSVDLHDPHDTPESLSLPILQLFELHSSNSRRSLVTQVSTFFPYAFWQWMPIHTPSAKLVAPRVYGKRGRTTGSGQPTETQQMIP